MTSTDPFRHNFDATVRHSFTRQGVRAKSWSCFRPSSGDGRFFYTHSFRCFFSWTPLHLSAHLFLMQVISLPPLFHLHHARATERAALKQSLRKPEPTGLRVGQAARGRRALKPAPAPKVLCITLALLERTCSHHSQLSVIFHYTQSLFDSEKGHGMALFRADEGSCARVWWGALIAMGRGWKRIERRKREKKREGSPPHTRPCPPQGVRQKDAPTRTRTGHTPRQTGRRRRPRPRRRPRSRPRPWPHGAGAWRPCRRRHG